MKKGDNITIGEYNTEIEAAQAYNIGALILNGPTTPLNPVPTPSMETYESVINNLKKQGWRASNNEMRRVRDLMRIYLKMPFTRGI